MLFSSVYRRILLKVSGEALGNKVSSSIDPLTLNRLAADIVTIAKLDLEIAIVLGGGNLFRGASLSSLGIDRITGDQMGMLATVMNALAMRDVLEQHGASARVMSAIGIQGIAGTFERQKAIRCLKKKHILLLAGGTGNPLVTTDSAASLRGVEIGADVLLKATHVDGVYSADPAKDPDAVLYSHLTYQKALDQELGIMDLAAFCQCREHNLPIQIFNIHQPNVLLDIVRGEKCGTLIDNRDVL